MGIILTTINTFFGIINGVFGIISTLFTLINILMIGTLVFAIVYIGPKIKGIFDGYSAYQELTKKFTDTGGNTPSCLTEKEKEDFKKKIDFAIVNINQFKNIPVIGGMIPENIETMVQEVIQNLDNIPICQ
jgi:hypothetical protein